MKTITREYKLYNLAELSKEAKEKALNDWNGDNEFPFLEECMNDMLDELLKKYNLKSEDAKCYYSLGYCQGDGAMFEGLIEWRNYYVNIKHSGHYYHYNSKEYTIRTKKTDSEANENTHNQFEKIYRKICDELEKVGYDFIEAEQSMDNFQETCKANEYTFLSSGIMMNE
jgi:hypothetical protein|tara:strand:+ start:73 stop:582 length:510 start_codon:yes stop_codon:yes gene_type:complete